MIHPLFFDDREIFNSLFYNVFNNIHNLQSALNKIPEIQSRVDRVAQAGDRFTEDLPGLARLKEYVTPLETELAGALPQVRDEVLRPVRQREAAIGIAILRRETDAQGSPRSVEQLAALNEVVELVKTTEPRDDAGPVLAHAEAVIGKDLEALLAAERRETADVPQSLDGLARLKQWQAATAGRFAKFAAYAPYQAVMNDTAARAAAIESAIVQELPSIVARAPDVAAVRAIRAALDSLPKDGKEGGTATPLSMAYRKGLDQWLSAAVGNVTRSAPARNAAPDASQAATINPLGGLANLPSANVQTSSACPSSGLKETELVGAICRKDFRTVYRSQDRTYGYLVEMLKVIGQQCQGIVSGDFIRSVLKQQTSPDILTNPKAMENAGLNVLLGTLLEAGRASKNPGRWLDEKITESELVGRAQADAMTMLGSGCDDPTLKTFLANAETFFADPAAGIPESELSMSDVCKRAQPEREAGYRKVKYCSCAGPVLERLSGTEKAFIRADARQNLWDAISLIPGLRTEIGKCNL
jgi:hypothetical protein